MKKILEKIRFRKLIFIIVLVSVISGIIYGIYSTVSSSGKQTEKTAVIEKNLLKFAKIKRESVNDQINILGQITFYEKVTVSSKVTGRIEKIYIDTGKKVKKNEILAQIEKLPLILSLNQQKSELDIAKKSYDLTKVEYENALKSIEIKIKTIQKAQLELKDKLQSFQNMDKKYNNKVELAKMGAVSDIELDNIKTQHSTLKTEYLQAKSDLEIQMVGYRDSDIKAEGYKVPKDTKDKIELLKKINTKTEQAQVSAAKSKINQVQSSLRSTELMLKESTIRSPINGIVATKDIESGEMVKSESTITTIMNISKVYITFNINESDIKNIRTGQKVNFTVDAFPGKDFAAVIHTISPFLDTKTRTIEVKAVLDNPEMSLLPGMFARAEVILGVRENIILIPAESVINRIEKEAYVYTVKNKTVFKIKIEIESEYGNSFIVKSGLVPDDILVTGGINILHEGMQLSE